MCGAPGAGGPVRRRARPARRGPAVRVGGFVRCEGHGASVERRRARRKAVARLAVRGPGRQGRPILDSAHGRQRIGRVPARLAGPVGLLDEDGEPVNRWWFVFADDRGRQVYPDWDGVADERIAELRAESALDDPFLAHLVEELEIVGGAPFTDRLAAAPAVPRRTGLERLVHPEAGEL
ncbi:hypothetical protein [Streptomonospora nanhaiensis]|uniref:MmyB family transcriptional regulator n=1 Tax=Streptomonospora nanhaiensis TaxID=1323731 RepID=UPI0032086C9F